MFNTGIHTVPFFKCGSWCLTAQLRLWHTGSSGLSRIFDYDLYCRTWACLLCTSCLHPLH